MIVGTVNPRREAVVGLRLRGPGGTELDIEAVIDTGFTTSLTLPFASVSALGLLFQTNGGVVLVDGSIRQFGIDAAEVWCGTLWRLVLVSALGSEVLAGMRLLEGHRLSVEALPGGSVEITVLP